MDVGGIAMRFVDPVALLLVMGGAVGLGLFRATREDRGRAFACLPLLFRADPDADALAARVAVNRIEAVTQARSIACADRVETAERFLRRAAVQLADARRSADFDRWAEDELEGRRARHDGAIGVWRTVADTAPVMGMIGTIIGLVQMFATMADPSAIGPAMALAMLTTLYGVFVSGVIAGPIASRLERLSATQARWQRSALERLAVLARAELDIIEAPTAPKPQPRPLRTAA